MKYRWEHDQYYKANKYQDEQQRKAQPKAAMEPDNDEREAYEKQAQELLEGKQAWRPTWQALGLNYDRPAVLPRSGSKTPSSTGS